MNFDLDEVVANQRTIPADYGIRESQDPDIETVWNKTNLKYSEDEIMIRAMDYIVSTYGEHYMEDDNVQFMDLVMADSLHGIGFLKYNAQKYIARYGKKAGYNEKDILKAIHYLALLLYKVRKDTENLGENE